ncbi:hypothetical protein P153DRAFT_329640 [Dothidotthia symphoricarpi CBS 119687]|uniref:Apple domain-containing protein n=1 Tax=Dothidotthia symphoricarpi CBS 119687 TaxID=1392245 RepID=A0A6A6AS81_9PLEO|nr:uncharacterized protein P153DRAFT_329640 [Dothidotthia symphoricarpi CBS 119687]KAF2134852.1 hypothetical protein P153DRAFT_329640 [Dothidotthia symphoricarpi CBS 119687]
MRSYVLIGAAALVAAAPAPAPQAFDPAAIGALPSIAQGPPVGIGAASQTAYNQGQAQTKAAAAAVGPKTAPKAKRDADVVEARTNKLKAGPAYGASYNTTSNAAYATPTYGTPYGQSSSQAAYDATPTSSQSATCTPIGGSNNGDYTPSTNPSDACAPQPSAYGPPTVPDTAQNFKNNKVYHNMAKSASAPAGYEQSFVNLDAATHGNGYIAYKSLESYDVLACSSWCDLTTTCTGFNVYIERDPAWNPTQCSCTNPPSVANYKCSLWGQPVDSSSATNTGAGSGDFEVVITSSNGYNKKTYTPANPPNTSNPKDCGTKLINQPQANMGQSTFPGPFDPSLCAAYAQKQNDVNRKADVLSWALSLLGMNKAACVQFQAAYLMKDGMGFGTHCRLFTQKFTPAQATYDISSGSYGTAGWSVSKSFIWDVNSQASFNWGSKSY